jgi:hypothetical protein
VKSRHADVIADIAVIAGLIAIGLLASSALAGSTSGPKPYTSFSDSDLNGVDFSGGYLRLEDFEDNQLNLLGVTASAGDPFPPGGITDSVDADDGATDGSGTAGHSFFSSAGSAGITFTFDKDALGSLPTHAGIVWTDGLGTLTFDAFDENGISLGAVGPVSSAGVFPDDNFSGGTAEDRFFGAQNDNGISKIFISNSDGGIEVDHLQYGAVSAIEPPPPPPTGIPLPAGAWAGGVMFSTLAGLRGRVRKLVMG